MKPFLKVSHVVKDYNDMQEHNTECQTLTIRLRVILSVESGRETHFRSCVIAFQEDATEVTITQRITFTVLRGQKRERLK